MTARPSTPPTPAEPLQGRHVTVVGLGRFGGGVGVTRWLVSQGALVTVSDRASAEDLAESVRAIEDLPVTLHLGGHQEADFRDAELLVVNPAVPKELPALRAALQAGVPWTTEINLFLQRCRAPVVGITGSVGKSTTTAMAGAILSRRTTAHVGGNIGRSLLQDLDAISPEHVVVLELSSFQLDDLPQAAVSPHVAAVTNLVPNHLDRHESLAAYAAAKANIFRYQSARDVLILNAACDALAGWAEQAPGQVAWFDPAAEPFTLRVPGRHNQANAQAAWAIAQPFGISRETAAEALAEFAGLEHRLQFVRQVRGVDYFNDSKCTSPEGAIVAAESFPPGRSVFIVGGYDKGVQFTSMAEALAGRAKALVVIGDTAGKIISAVEHAAGDRHVDIRRAESLESAVRLARMIAGPGDAIVLSPACASYDMFTHYVERGERFVELVEQLAAEAGEVG